MERSFTIAEAARVLNAHPVSVRREIRRGRLTAYRVGRLVRIPAEALREYASGGDLHHIARRPCVSRKPTAELQSA